MNRRERTLVVATLIASALAGAAWGCVRLVSSADEAASAARGLAECERLARRIEAARGETLPVGAESAARGAKTPELNIRIESAARSAELPVESVGLIEPGPARRLGDGPFVEQPTGIQLRGVALRQLFTFLHALASEDSRVGIKSIRLATPLGDAPADLWNVEGTLTQTTYAPKDSAAARAAATARR